MVNHAGNYGNVNSAAGDNGIAEDEYGGPILQPIPDYLMVNDYIEISGVCRGQEVIVELLADPQRASQDPEILPLHIGLTVGGPALIWSQSREKVERQEHNVRAGLHPNAAFELCIYAMEDGFEIKLNKELICRHKYLTNLEEIVAISMDGDADFTSIEFKDIYGEENEAPFEAEPHPSGFMRVQSFRTSASRKPGSPQLVRSSTRRSGRANVPQSPITAQHPASTLKQEWRTSSDLSRPVLDVDSGKETTHMAYQQPGVELRSDYGSYNRASTMADASSPSRSRLNLKPGGRKSFTLEDAKLEQHALVGGSQSHVVAGDAHQGSYQPVDDDQKPAYRPHSMYPAGYVTLNGSTASVQEKSRKNRLSSLFSKHRKSKGSESDISIGGAEKESKRKGLKGLFKRKKSVDSTSATQIRASSSLPDFSRQQSNEYFGDSTSQYMKPTLYLGAGPDRSHVPGPVPKSKLKQPAPEIAAYMAGQKAVPEFENFHLSQPTNLTLPSTNILTPVPTDDIPHDHSSVVSSVSGQRKLKGTAPELADILIDTGRAGFKQNTTLTTNWHQVALSPPGRADEPNVFIKEPTTKLKGTAPEMASNLSGRYGHQDTKDITLINGAPVDTASAISVVTMPVANTEAYKAVGVEKPDKLKGTSAEIAARINESSIYNQRNFPESTLTMMPARQDRRPISFERPKLDVDMTFSQPELVKAQYEEPPAYLARPASLDRSATNHYESGGSTVHSDDEHYLEVGRSAYYFERQQSLAKWPTRRSRSVRRTGSPSSSISSLKQEEFDVIMNSRPKQSATRLDQVHSWLNSGYANESPIYPMAANRPVVYAACPNIHSSFKNDMSIPVKELKKEMVDVRIPAVIHHGRAVMVTGHFLSHNDNTEARYCLVHLTSAEDMGEIDACTIVLHIWSNGNLKVIGNRHQVTFTMVEWISPVPVENDQFSITIHARGLYNAFTINDVVTLRSRASLDLADLKYLRFRDSASAELDQIRISDNLVLPLHLAFPVGLQDESTQVFGMHTNLTASSERIVLGLSTRGNQRFELVLDFVKDRVYLLPATVDSAKGDEIPYVPEQVKEICIQLRKGDGKLTAFVNQEEIVSKLLQSPELPMEFSQVYINGDFMLLGTSFE